MICQVLLTGYEAFLDLKKKQIHIKTSKCEDSCRNYINIPRYANGYMFTSIPHWFFTSSFSPFCKLYIFSNISPLILPE